MTTLFHFRVRVASAAAAMLLCLVGCDGIIGSPRGADRLPDGAPLPDGGIAPTPPPAPFGYAPDERACPTCLVMPIEVLGAAGTTREVSITLANEVASRARTLALYVHGLAFQDMASVQLNDAPAVTLNNTHVTVEGLGRTYGGIGGGFASLKLTIAIAPGAVRAGANTLRFRFERTDGRVLGFRVLGFNFRDEANANLLPLATTFRWDDPREWRAPRTTPTDIAAGEQLWRTAVLRDSPSSTRNLRATCSDCHAQDGHDLQYFNFSNLSIIERSRFHGLSTEQGEQIASYIRSRPGPRPGRPWNPPFQPGPGVDSRPVEEWSAGAGLEWVLDHDADMAPYLPGRGVDPRALIERGRIREINLREVPIALQLLDWNHWLPAVHPKDSLPSREAYQALNNTVLYNEIREGLAGRLRSDDRVLTREEYISHRLPNALDSWANSMTYSYGAVTGLYAALLEGERTQQQLIDVYAAGAYNAVKQWELMREFQLEGLGPQFFGVHGESRSWFSNRHVFDVSPHIIGQLAGLDLIRRFRTHGDGDPELLNAFLANAWYQLQNILNNGNRHYTRGGHHTIDWGYQAGLFGDLERASRQTEPMRRTAFTIKSMQEHDSGVGPADHWFGWNLRDELPGAINLEADWSRVPDANRVIQTIHQVWIEKSATFRAEEWRLAVGYDGANVEGPDWVFGGPLDSGERQARSIANWFWDDVHWLHTHQTVHPAVVRGLANFGRLMWPANDWTARGGAAAPATVVAVPQGVSATAGVEQVTLTWSAVAGAQSYNVKRATQREGAYLPVALLLDATRFVDSRLVAGTAYYYTVSANTAAQEGPDSPPVEVTPTTGLVAHWTFDEPSGTSAADASPTQNNGQLIGGAMHVAGRRGGAIEFDGRSGFLSVPFELQRHLGASATLAAWVRTRAAPQGDYAGRPCIAGVAGSGTDETYWGSLDSRGRMGINLYGSDEGFVWSPEPINDGAWHHVAFTRDETRGAVEIYVDGARVAQGISRTGRLRMRTFSVGRTDSSFNYWPGALDDVRIYNRVLTSEEISSIARAQ